MTLDKLNEILETHGSDEKQWPEAVRQQCQDLLSREPAARQLLRQHQALQAQLEQMPQPQFPGLEQKVLNQSLPPQATGLLDRLLSWLIPAGESPGKILRPAFVACLALILGIVVGNFYSFGLEPSADGFQYWEDELLMLSFSEYSESGLTL